MPTFRFGVPERPKEVVAKDTDEIPVRFAPEPLNEVAVTTPDAFTPVTVILGLPDNPVALPVRAPTNVVAVATPDALRLVAAIVPTVILGVPDKPVAVPVTLPLKLVALTTPTTLSLDVGTVDPIPTLPLESIVSAFEFAILARSLALVIFLCFLDIYGKKKRGVILPLSILFFWCWFRSF
jgi:hypothetical protein